MPGPTSQEPHGGLAAGLLAARLPALGASLVILLATLSLAAEQASATQPVPTVTTQSGSPLGETEAELTGSVNPNGANVTDCRFEYGLTGGYGASVACSASVGSGSAPVPVSAHLEGLTGAATYHFRLVASNAGGPGMGEDGAFTTPLRPSVLTSSPLLPTPTAVGGSTSATLQGSVAANGSEVTDCHFEYGPSPSLGLSAPCAQLVGAGSVPVSVSAVLSGLPFATYYWVKLIASNAAGLSAGDEVLFLTAEEALLGNPYPSPYVTPEYNYPPVQKNSSPASGRGPAQTNPHDIGLYVAYCPRRAASSSLRIASAAGTSEKGWPPKQCLKMDKGPAGRSHTLVGEQGVHNWLLGGYGNDTIIGGNLGDVIWGDYHPEGEPKHQTATIHAGNGRNVIYANDTRDYVWTGSNPRTIVHAHASGISGVIHCGSSQQVMYLSTVSEKHFQLIGCGRISHYSVGY